MTNPSLGKKKRKITYTASLQGLERAEKALKRLGFESKENLTKPTQLSRSTVTKFFQRQPIQFDSFKRICDALTLNWAEIAGLIDQEQSEPLEIDDCSSPDINQEVRQMQILRRVTVIDKKSQKIKAIITLEGNINSSPNRKIIQSILQEYSGDSINIIDIKEGSIKLIVEGYPEDIRRLKSRIKSKELTELNSFPVEDIQILGKNSDDDESNELNDKWLLVQDIVSQAAEGWKLSDVDLSDADLRGADLRGADLRGANLSNADLRGADLNNADLSNADLSGTDLSGADLNNAGLNFTDLSDADLSGTDLSGADLRRADLSGADLSGADLSGADFRDAIIGSSTKLNNRWYLVWKIVTQGAKWQDLSGIDLRSADLRNANLRGANLENANLRGADLRGADLRDANLKGANVKYVLFGNNLGISESKKQKLILQGAIFEDSPGSPSKILAVG